MSLRTILKFSFLILFASQTLLAFSQGRGGGFGSNFGSALSGGSGGGSRLGLVTYDTSEIHYFYANDPNLIYPFSDSLLDDFEVYDPAQQQEFHHAHLGNLGSAHRPLFFGPALRRGFDVGLHQFDLYEVNTADIRYYRITQAYTQAAYSQGPLQTDAQMLVRFSRNFSRTMNFSIEHRRINNGGSYDYQRATNSSVAAGLWYHEPYGRYDSFLSLTTNSHFQEENGGAAESLTDTIIEPFKVKINRQTPFTRHAHTELAYTQYFYLNRLTPEQKALIKKQKEQEKRLRQEQLRNPQPDSLRQQNRPARPQSGRPPLQQGRPLQQKPPGVQNQPNAPGRDSGQVQQPLPVIVKPPVAKRVFNFYHQLSWKSSTYKFAETDADSTFYGDLAVDDRGLRHYLEVRRLQNDFSLQTFKLRESKGQIVPADRLEVGLLHALYLIDQEPLSRTIRNDLFLTGKLQLSPSDRMELQAYGHLGIGADAGDYRLSGNLLINLNKLGQLQLEVVNQLYSPSLLAQQYFLSNQQIWKNDFGRTFETSFSGTYAVPVLKASATLRYHLADGYIYYDENARPAQSGTFSVWQLVFRKDFSLGPLHNENWVGLQRTATEAFAGPELYSHHSLFLEGKIFKKVMLARFGLRGRFISSYNAPAWSPAIGQFLVQQARSLPFTPLVDVFASFKVKTFRFFLRIDNVLSRPLNTHFFQTLDYPLPYGYNNGGVRFGINWRLVD
ncbi:MAG: hypothetical protein CMN32_10705 [Saprospirales bacterium]|nr:hypothetical protein [Saprospirales bacterium]